MRLYRALLHLLPVSFRNEYGNEMASDFARRSKHPFLWLDAIADVGATAVSAHLDILRQDLRYAARSIVRAPGYALVVIAVAALGIGASTAAFTMANHVLLRPLPFPEPDRLVKFLNVNTAQGPMWDDLAPVNYRDWKNMATSFSAMGAWSNMTVNLVGVGDPQRIAAATMTSDLLPILGARPLLGRTFAPGEDRYGEAGAVLLSYPLWQTTFGADAGVLGRKVVLDGEAYAVIGVMPPSFYFPTREAQLWTAARWTPDQYAERNNNFIYAIGRLKDGVSIHQADAEMRTIGSAIARQFPDVLDRTTASVRPFSASIGTQSQLVLNLLMAASLCVLLIACCNLANLAIARAMVRDRELAVRTALGAGRERLVRLMLTDSLLLAAAGGVAGFALGRAALPLLVRLIPVSLPIAEIPALDWRVMLFAAAATLATALACGVLPAFRNRNLNQASRTSGGARRSATRDALVASQIAATVVLLVTFGLLTRALLRVQATDPGFRTTNVMRLRTALPMPKYEQLEVRDAYYQRVMAEAKRLPGVTAVAWVTSVPMATKGQIWPVEIVGRPQKPADRQSASLRYVTPGYFTAMGIPLLGGRDVADTDTSTLPYVAVVSRSFAQRYWPGESPVGRQIKYGNNDRTIIGVVGDVRVRGLEQESEPQVYLSWRQPRGAFVGGYAPKDLVVRASGDPMRLADALRRIVHNADPTQPVTDLEPLDNVVSAETAGRRVQVAALGTFAVVAFLLAAIGIHGLLSYTVSSRTQEIGVRMALGAKASQIAAMTLAAGLRLAAIGVVLGAAAAWVAGRLLQSILAGVSPRDLTTFAAATALALLMTLAGSLPPAIRAARLDPVQAIRAD